MNQRDPVSKAIIVVAASSKITKSLTLVPSLQFMNKSISMFSMHFSYVYIYRFHP